MKFIITTSIRETHTIEAENQEAAESTARIMARHHDRSIQANIDSITSVGCTENCYINTEVLTPLSY